MPALESYAWTTDRPTEPGWYWYRRWKDKPGRCVEVTESKKSGLVFNGWEIALTEGQWAGPIEQPVECAVA